MENDGVSPSSAKRRNDDPPFSLIKGADQDVDSPRFEERLIPQADENPTTAGMNGLNASSDRSAHPPVRIGIYDDFHFSSLQQVFHPFVSTAQDDD
jgi:hypothetical protein